MKIARTFSNLTRLNKFVMIAVTGLALTSCQGGIDSVFPKAERPIPDKLIKRMKAKGMKPSSPILLRIYKEDSVLEVWKQKDTGRYGLLESYEICKWSGKLGPKFKEGDRQAPEGFYNVGKGQLNPKSKYHLSFNIGYPNSYDRSHGRTGTHLMVHGACSSAGCYSMTDELVEQIYSLARDAIKGGQDYFQVQAYPFRMTVANLAKHADNPNFEFWKMLKEGSDHFELTNYPPKVDVCEKRYIFNREAVGNARFVPSASCPQVTMPERLISAYSAKLAEEKIEFKKLIHREKARAKITGSALANVDVEKLSIVPYGAEVLPPPTPKPEALVASAPTPSKTTVTVAPSGQVTENRNIAAAESPAIDGGRGSSIDKTTAVSKATDNGSSDASMSATPVVEGSAQDNLNPDAVPVPRPAPLQIVEEEKPAKKTP